MERIEYLTQIANSLPVEDDVLKSYYFTKCRLLEFTNVAKSAVVQPINHCSKCCLKYTDHVTSYKILPHKKVTKFERQLMKKLDKSKPVTKFQATYLKKMEKTGNYLVLTCSKCKNQVRRRFVKPSKPVEEKDAVPETPRSQKKKKKEKYAGLNEDAVLSVKSVLFTPAKETNVAPPINRKQKKYLERKESRKNILAQNKQSAKKRQSLSKLSNILEKQKAATPSQSLKLFLKNL